MFYEICFIVYFLHFASGSEEYSLTNKTVIVTGGARGIGYYIADNFLAEGAKTIIIVDKNNTYGITAAKTLNSKHGCNKVVYIHCHVFDDMECWDDIVSAHDQIDVLVNNAGILDEYDIPEMVHTNVAAPMIWAFKFRDYNRKDRNGNGGTIINISSRAGYAVVPFITAYSATKYAVKGFTMDFGHDYNFRKTGVRVVGVCPDFTDTEMSKLQMAENDQAEIFKKLKESYSMQSPGDVAKAVVKVYNTAKTGTLWAVSDGKLRPAPNLEMITTDYIENLGKPSTILSEIVSVINKFS